jgi:hypothetical protein
MSAKKASAQRPDTRPLPRAAQGLSDRELDARLHDAVVELVAAELPSLARAVQEARRRLGFLLGGRR